MIAVVQLPFWGLGVVFLGLCWLPDGLRLLRRKLGVGGSIRAHCPAPGLTATADADTYPRVVKTIHGVPRETIYARSQPELRSALASLGDTE